jgi:hypothetical protein
MSVTIKPTESPVAANSGRTVVLVSLAWAVRVALDDIVSREELEDNSVPLNSADSLRGKDEP